MKYYDSIHKFPVGNLIDIQRSVNEGKPDFRYMIIGSDVKMPRRVNKKECKKAYDNMLIQMPSSDNKLYKKWVLYNNELARVQTKSKINDCLHSLGKRKKKIDLNRANIAFGNYLDEFELRHKDFGFKVYSIKRNYQELWEKHFPGIPIPKRLIERQDYINRKDLNFFLFEEYFDFLDDFKTVEELGQKAIMLTDTFLDNFIITEMRKYETIRWIEKRLNKFFISVGAPKKWKMIRTDFFAIDRMKCVSKSDKTLMNEVAYLRDYMNQTIPLSTGYTEYNTIRIEAEEKNKRETKNIKASG